MRRTIALIALLVTAWPHAAVLECALGAEAPGGEPAHHASHGADRAHGPWAHGDADVPSGGSQCAMVMACGLAMIRTDGIERSRPETGDPEVVSQTFLTPPAATDLTSDPPPPRRHA
jgi:hypothetical protein